MSSSWGESYQSLSPDEGMKEIKRLYPSLKQEKIITKRIIFCAKSIY
jgi:hypothetical protein